MTKCQCYVYSLFHFPHKAKKINSCKFKSLAQIGLNQNFKLNYLMVIRVLVGFTLFNVFSASYSLTQPNCQKLLKFWQFGGVNSFKAFLRGQMKQQQHI